MLVLFFIGQQYKVDILSAINIDKIQKNKDDFKRNHPYY